MKSSKVIHHPSLNAENFSTVEAEIEAFRTANALTAVSADSAFANDNRLIKSAGTARKTEATGISVDDSNNVSGVVDLAGTSVTVTTVNATNALLSSYAEQTEVASPSSPAANKLRAYAKDDGAGATRMYFKDSAGLEVTPGMVLLAASTASGATLNIVLTAYTGFRGIVIYLNLLPATDDVELFMQLSTDGGANYDGSAGNYTWGLILGSSGAGTGTQGSASDTKLKIAGSIVATSSVGNAATEGVRATVTLLTQTSTALWADLCWDSIWIDAAATPIFWRGSGFGGRRAAQDTDAVRFLFESGDIASGTYAVYGLA